MSLKRSRSRRVGSTTRRCFRRFASPSFKPSTIYPNHDHVDRDRSPIEHGATYEREITRDEFDGLIADLVERTLGPCKQALKDAILDPEQIDEVVMVGGSTRIPLVRTQGERIVQTRASHRTQSRRSRRAGRGDSSRCPRAAAEETCFARRHSAESWHRDDGRRGREDHQSQLDHPRFGARRCSRPG